MSGLSINGRHLAVQGIKEVDPSLSIQEAAVKTNKNGINEVYFNSDGKNYVAYGDKLNIKALKKGDMPTVTMDGKKVNVVTFEDENNSIGSGISKGSLNGLRSARSVLDTAMSSTMRNLGFTTTVAAAGAVGLTGFAIAKGVSVSSASPIANILGDVLVKGSVKVAAGIAITAAAGFAISVVAGSIEGVAESLSVEKNYSTIASVTKEGNFKVSVPVAPDPTAPTAPVVEPKTSDSSRSGNISIKSIGGLKIGVSTKRAGK
ncbi:MAG: hypothetical protein H7263_15765 [Candidatus Sericytochromatia bacterium]|nr:hypothetical protein [Candidatus Sericytochromatia bacterium]